MRALYGTDGTQNATHGSDSAASAAREIAFFFPELQPDALEGPEATAAYLQVGLSQQLHQCSLSGRLNDPFTLLSASEVNRMMSRDSLHHKTAGIPMLAAAFS